MILAIIKQNKENTRRSAVLWVIWYKRWILRRGIWSVLHEGVVLILYNNDQISIREIKETHETGQNNKNSIFVNRLVFLTDLVIPWHSFRSDYYGNQLKYAETDTLVLTHHSKNNSTTIAPALIMKIRTNISARVSRPVLMNNQPSKSCMLTLIVT